jgi:dTDP-4-dehydrorhamnose reductase
MARHKAILLIGASGFLGTHLALHLRDTYKVYGTFHENFYPIPGITPIPVLSFEKDWIKRITYMVEPDVVIFAAGKGDPKEANNSSTAYDQVHTGGMATVATASEAFKAKFIYISNSYVFDGKKGNYHETDTPLPSTKLGKEKVGGENFLRGRSLNYVIIRSSPLIGRGNGARFSFFDRLRYHLDRDEKIELPKYDLHSFAPILGLLKMVGKLIESPIKNKVFHYGGLTRASHYDCGKMFAEKFGYNPNLVLPEKINLNPEHEELYYSDYSLNSTHSVKELKIKPLLLEETFDLLKENLIVLPR